MRRIHATYLGKHDETSSHTGVFFKAEVNNLNNLYNFHAHGVILIFTKPSDGPCALEDSQTIEFAVQHLTQMLQTASRSDKKASFVRTSCCLKSAEGHPITSASIILNGSFFYII